MVKVRDKYVIFTVGHLLFHVAVLPIDVLGIYEDRVLCNNHAYPLDVQTAVQNFSELIRRSLFLCGKMYERSACNVHLQLPVYRMAA